MLASSLYVTLLCRARRWSVMAGFSYDSRFARVPSMVGMMISRGDIAIVSL